jgi:mRNA interferase YafQ
MPLKLSNRLFRNLSRFSAESVNKVLRLLADDPFTPSLKSHKLGGNLAGLWSCSIAYDYRIIFRFSKDEQLLEIVILLVDIGSHNVSMITAPFWVVVLNV